MSRWSPVYVPEIETGRYVKNNACSVEIKIKWMIRKHIPWRYLGIFFFIRNKCQWSKCPGNMPKYYSSKYHLKKRFLYLYVLLHDFLVLISHIYFAYYLLPSLPHTFCVLSLLNVLLNVVFLVCAMYIGIYFCVDFWSYNS
jgi:hypothetical protein